MSSSAIPRNMVADVEGFKSTLLTMVDMAKAQLRLEGSRLWTPEEAIAILRAFVDMGRQKNGGAFPDDAGEPIQMWTFSDGIHTRKVIACDLAVLWHKLAMALLPNLSPMQRRNVKHIYCEVDMLNDGLSVKQTPLNFVCGDAEHHAAHLHRTGWYGPRD